MQDGNSPRQDRQLVNVAPRSGDTESGNHRASLNDKSRKAPNSKPDLYNTSELPQIQVTKTPKVPTNVFQTIMGPD